ncbi:MAG: hypothetical protein M0003_16255, partial [Acidithiobacillus sp.]|nr:hypothetical protein [Acidithiobacillus sp.]
QPVGRERAQGAPSAFELIDPGDEAQDLRRDLDSVGSQHEPILRPFTPIFEMPGWLGWRLMGQ